MIQDLYVKELKAFKPRRLTAADAEEATQPWHLPKALKTPALEAEGSDALAEYDSAAVEVKSAKTAASVEDAAADKDYNPDDWFVFPEDKA